MFVSKSFQARCVLLAALVMSWGCAPASAAPSGELIVVTSFPRSLFEPVREAFEAKYPDVHVFVRNKKTSAAISFIEERTDEPVDIFWASATDAFEILKSAGHLMPAFVDDVRADLRIGTYPVDDPEGFYKGFAISGYGLVWNVNYLAEKNLPVPTTWRDLANPIYARHIGISAPSRSGTTHLIVESILQEYGWVDGWKLLLEIGGNLATVTARSFSVIDGIKAGHFGIGVAIDFLGLSAKAMGAAVEYRYPSKASFLPANIGVVKRAANPEAARAFVDFVVSKPGQKILLRPAISRLPSLPEMYKDVPQGYPNPYEMTAGSAGRFDTDLSRKRYYLVNTLFDALITFRLQALRRAWLALHDAELSIPESSAEARRLLVEARAKLTSIPDSAADEQGDAFADIFVRPQPGLPRPQRQIEMEAQWTEFARKNHDAVMALVDEAVRKNGLQKN